MRILVADALRQIVAEIIIDDTPTEDEIDKKRTKVRPPTTDIKVERMRKSPEMVEKDIYPTKTPSIKPSRKQHKVSPWDYKDTRKEYMREWRENGQDAETGNKYIKKLKTK